MEKKYIILLTRIFSCKFIFKKEKEETKMKKIVSVLLLMVLALSCSLVSCDTAKVLTYDEYIAADVDDAVVVDVYVQATQAWWEDKITVYAADENGAYFIYEMACSKEDAAKLTAGTKIRVTGSKAEWSGEVEIVDATFKFLDGNYVATAKDLTAKLGTDDLIKYQNQLAAFNGLTVKSISYKNDAPGDGNDIYVTVTKDGADYDFCVEAYLTAPGSDVYDAFANSTVKVGDVIDVEGFVYWYNGVNTHITKVTVK